jgi:hypothetical protein
MNQSGSSSPQKWESSRACFSEISSSPTSKENPLYQKIHSLWTHLATEKRSPFEEKRKCFESRRPSIQRVTMNKRASLLDSSRQFSLYSLIPPTTQDDVRPFSYLER